MAMRRFKSLFFLLPVACMLAACTTSPTGRSQMILRSDDELAAEAARQFAELRASIPLETERATSRSTLGFFMRGGFRQSLAIRALVSTSSHAL